MVTAASAGPWLGPSAAFRSARAAAKGSAPNGTMSPVRANFWSGVTKRRKICCPCVVLNTAVTSAKPLSSAGLISAIFQVSSWFQPNICLRKLSTVASVGSPAADGAAVWATTRGAKAHNRKPRTAMHTVGLRRFFIFSFQSWTLWDRAQLRVEFGSNRIASTHSECFGRNLQSGSSLLALVLVAVYHAGHVAHQRGVEFVLGGNGIRG